MVFCQSRPFIDKAALFNSKKPSSICSFVLNGNECFWTKKEQEFFFHYLQVELICSVHVFVSNIAVC